MHDSVDYTKQSRQQFALWLYRWPQGKHKRAEQLHQENSRDVYNTAHRQWSACIHVV